jgi:hypothetical protein
MLWFTTYQQYNLLTYAETRRLALEAHETIDCELVVLAAAMDIKTIGTIAASAGVVVTLVSNVFGVLDKAISYGKSIMRWFGPGDRAPSKTMVALVNPRINALYWGHATVAGKPGMQVVGDFIVTNVTKGDLLLPIGILRYRRGMIRKRVRTGPMVKHAPSGYSSSSYSIPPMDTADVRVGFIYPDPDRPSPGDFAADVGFVDQFGNHHWLRRLQFKHPEKMYT